MSTENKMHSDQKFAHPRENYLIRQSSNKSFIYQNKFLQEFEDINSRKLDRLQKIQELIYKDLETSPGKIFQSIGLYYEFSF